MANTIGMRIKEQREKAGLSQKELAELTGVSNNTICNWERGNTTPAASAVGQIADVLGIDPTAILYGEKDAETTQLAEEPKKAEPEPIKEVIPPARFSVS